MKKNIFALLVASLFFLGCAGKGTVNESPAPVPPAGTASPAPDTSASPGMSPAPDATTTPGMSPSPSATGDASHDGHDHSGDDHEGHDH